MYCCQCGSPLIFRRKSPLHDQSSRTTPGLRAGKFSCNSPRSISPHTGRGNSTLTTCLQCRFRTNLAGNIQGRSDQNRPFDTRSWSWVEATPYFQDREPVIAGLHIEDRVINWAYRYPLHDQRDRSVLVTSIRFREGSRIAWRRGKQATAACLEQLSPR